MNEDTPRQVSPEPGPEREPQDEAPPSWLASLLRTAGPEPADFRPACRQAGGTALALTGMRRVSQRMNTPLVGVPAYLRSLAGAAGAALEPVLRWAGLDLGHAADRRFGGAWGRLAVAFGLTAREALLHLRLTFADEARQELGARLLIAMRSQHGPADLLDRCERLLDETVPAWDESVRGRLRDSETELLAVYRQAVRAGDVV
jgi:hypothetical protein